MVTTTIVAPVGIPLSVFIGKNGALGLQHSRGNNILRSDQFQLIGLTLQFILNLSIDIRVCLFERCHTFRLKMLSLILKEKKRQHRQGLPKNCRQGRQQDNKTVVC
jgi:hypothetical protein